MVGDVGFEYGESGEPHVDESDDRLSRLRSVWCVGGMGDLVGDQSGRCRDRCLVNTGTGVRRRSPWRPFRGSNTGKVGLGATTTSNKDHVDLRSAGGAHRARSAIRSSAPGSLHSGVDLDEL